MKRLQIANLAFQILNHTVSLLQQDKGFQDLTNDRDFFIQSTTGIMYEDTKSVDKILWCDHSNETSLSALLLGPVCLFVCLFLRNSRKNEINFTWELN